MLTERETQVLRYAAVGLTVEGIAKVLDLSSSTVKVHLTSARERLGAWNTTHAVALAIRSGAI